MNYYIVIPAHNEASFIAKTLDSVLRQTLPPARVVVVNDHSTDETQRIVDTYSRTNPGLRSINITSSTSHLPGSKVIKAFNKGMELLDSGYDFVVKLDADIILPEEYFEKVAGIFNANPKVGIAGGFAYEQDTGGEWRQNHPMNHDHVRGAFKAYSKNCFTDIGGLKTAMGWDTMDELLARYHGYEIVADPSLMVKHLRPTGRAYDKKAKRFQGEAMYTMRYGIWISCIASLKMAWKQRNPAVFRDNMLGFIHAIKTGRPYQVSEDEGRFIRNLRWKNIKARLL